MFYLCGDEMFLETILDGNDVIGPATATGWNIYREANRKLNRQVSYTTDSEHLHSIFSYIPINQTYVCFMALQGVWPIF